MHSDPEIQSYISAGAMASTNSLGATPLHVLGRVSASFHCRWTDTASAIGTFLVEGSNDNTNWLPLNVVIPKQPNAATDKCTIVVPCVMGHIRLTYTNTSGTGTLNVAVALNAVPSSVEVNRVIVPGKIVNGGNATILSASATQLTATSTPLMAGVTVKALAANTGKIYVGDSTVTATPGATCGFELSAGQEKFFEIDNVNKLYAIATVNNEDVCWGGS